MDKELLDFYIDVLKSGRDSEMEEHAIDWYNRRETIEEEL